MPAVLIRSYWSDLRPELFRVWGGRVEPATTTNFDFQTNLARVGPSGSGLPSGCREDVEGMEAALDDGFGCPAGLDGEGGK